MFTILREEVAAAKKQEETDLWGIFAELEVKTNSLQHLGFFCFQYMPSFLEIIEPAETTLEQGELSAFLNDLQGKLHQVDMISKQMKMEYDLIRQAMHNVLGNYVVLLLGHNNLTSEMLSSLTGVQKDKLEDFLDILIDEGKIDLKEGIYYLQQQEKKHG